MVPKRQGKVASHGAQAGGQVGQVRPGSERSGPQLYGLREPERARPLRSRTRLWLCHESRWLRPRRSPQSGLARIPRLRVNANANAACDIIRDQPVALRMSAASEFVSECGCYYKINLYSLTWLRV